MGTREIFKRSSESTTHCQNILVLKTPSPLTSSTSSGSSSTSLLTGIKELTSSELIHRFKNLKNIASGREPEDEEFSEGAQSLEARERRRNKKTEESASESNKTSNQSSPSSLKRKLCESPSPSEARKLAEHAASLDRRIRHERDVLLQLHDPNDRIDERDEDEASSVVCRASTQNIFGENSDRPEIADEAQKIKMCSSSAPETMRLEKQSYEQRLQDFTKDLRKPVIRNFDERRPPKFLQPLRPQSREILRNNAPPLCLTDKKIVELLRRGSMSAREEYLKKSTNAAQKCCISRQPTGMIIKNLSSGSEEDNCMNEWIIKNSSGSNVTKFGNETKAEANSRAGNDKSIGHGIPDFSEEMKNQEAKNRTHAENFRENEFFDVPQSARSVKSVRKSSNAGNANLIEEIEISDHSRTSRSANSIQKSLKSSMAELRSVLNSIDVKSRDTRPLAVPKLEIQSQEYSQSTSVGSREDSAKKPLDMKALICALSDVSLRQQKLGDCKAPPVCNNVASEPEEPKPTRYTSVADGSRQSIVAPEIIEQQEKSGNYSLLQNFSPASIDTATKCTESCSSRSKIPIVVGETLDKVNRDTSSLDLRVNSRRKIAVDDSAVSDRDHNSKIVPSKISPTGINSKCQSVHSVSSEVQVIKPVKVYSPPMKRNRHSKSTRTSRTEASSYREISSKLGKSLRSSDCRLESSERHGRKATKVTAGPSKVASEPCSSRNGEKLRPDNSPSRVASSAREFLPGILKDHPRSSDEKYKYLRRGSQIPYVLSSSSDSSSESEESEQLEKIVTSSDGQRSDGLKTKGQFKIYEDTDEASPRPQLSLSVNELNSKSENASARAFQSCREIRKIDTKSLRPKVLTENEVSRLNSSPEDSVHLSNPSGENIHSRESVESRNVFWADSSSELNRAMGSSFESSQVTTSGAHSRLISPSRTVVKMKKSATSSCKSTSKKSSCNSSKATQSSVSPRCSYDENARTMHRNLAAGAFDYFVADAKRRNEEENIFSATPIVKRLSYSEIKEAPADGEASPVCRNHFQEPPEASLAEEFVNDSRLSVSQANLAAMTGRSDGAVHLFRRAFDRATTRVKVASSLSKLTSSPNDQRRECSNFFAGRRSQDRFPFTISESNSGKSSSQCKAEQAIQENSSSKIVEPLTTAYRLTAHPSILRLASAGIEATAAEIIQSASCDPDIRVPSRNVPRLRKFLGFSWGKSGNKKDDSGSKTTRILYRNNKYAGGSADESSISANSVSTEKPRRQFDRDDMWVEGLRGDENFDGDDVKNNCLVKTGDAPGKEQQYEEDRFSFFLAKTESPSPRAVSTRAFDANTPMNSLMFDEDPDVEVDPGCLCARFCLFLIDGTARPRHRTSLRLRNRRPRIRRTF